MNWRNLFLSKRGEKVKKVCDLSKGQYDIWVQSLLDPKNSCYNVPMLYKATGSIEINQLQSSVQQTLNSIEIFKTEIFKTSEGSVRQRINNDKMISVDVINSKLSLEDLTAQIAEVESKKPFILEKDLLVRASIYKLQDDNILLFINVSHIIFDGLSINLLFNEIIKNYTKINKKIAKKESSYINFVQEQKEVLQNDTSAKKYWEKKKQDFSNGLFERDFKSFFVNKLLITSINESRLKKIVSTSEKQKISNFVYYLGAYALALSKVNRQNKVSIAFPYMNRQNEMYSEIGMFINIIFVNLEVNFDDTFAQFFRKVTDEVYEALKYGYYPLNDLNRSSQINGLATGTLYYQNWVRELTGITADNESKLSLEYVPSIFQQGELPAVLEILEMTDSADVKMRYSENNEEQADKVFHNFMKISEMIPDCFEQKISSLFEKKEKDIVELIRLAAKDCPDKIALKNEHESITYRNLMEKTDMRAAFLQNEGIRPGMLVGILSERNLEAVINILALMISRAVYIPLDSSYPTERLNYMIEDSNMDYLIDMEKKIKSVSHAILVQDVAYTEARVDKDVNVYEEDQPVYILYTSGSTGKPKGVEVTRKNLTNAITSFKERLCFTDSDEMFSITTFSFDIAQLEILLPLISGGTVEVALPEVVADYSMLKQKIANMDANFFQATPSTLKALINLGGSFKEGTTILCGGEELKKGLAKKLLSQRVALWNMYGPTETTIWSTMTRIYDSDAINLGKPIDNTEIYIVNEELTPVAFGQEGEIVITGAGVANGYLNQPHQTADRFKVFIDNKVGYFTGDYGKFSTEKSLLFLGRRDQQVKIRGHRIELGEIEYQLEEIAGVKETCVLLDEHSQGIHRLLAFITTTGTNVLKTDKIAHEMSKKLPKHMQPVKYFMLDALPYTLNNKVDTRKLRALVEDNKGTQRNNLLQPLSENKIQNKIEKYISVKLENHQKINDNENIGFYGFDSTSFAEFSVFINEEFRLNVKPMIFYQYDTVHKLTAYIQKEQLRLAESTENRTTIPSISDEKQEKVTSEEDTIVVVGMSGRFPGSDDLNEFWNNLVNGKDSVILIDLLKKYRGQEISSEMLMQKVFLGELENEKAFDASFFGISPREAKLMDPQQRLILQSVWHTIEDSGHRMSEYSGSNTGVFIGSSGSDYMGLVKEITGHTLTGISKSLIPNRVSYLFDFHGPSEVIDTACSSSLVAIHRAVQAIKTGECDQAIAGGVNLVLSPFSTDASVKLGMLSKTGCCKTFDASADGYVRGEGVGTLLLKRRSDALKDRDHIYCSILSNEVNHGGRANSITAPNTNAQKELIKKAVVKDSFTVNEISYIETHGTGTPLGDPIEIEALKAAFKELGHTSEKNTGVLLGSVKTNIGHLEAAGGIASVMKVILAMKYSFLPGNIHLNNVNELIDLSDSPFSLIKEGQSWEPIDADGNSIPKISGVSSFGYGGVNAHLVIKENEIYEVAEKNINDVQLLFPISAKNEVSLQIKREELADFLTENPDLAIEDVYYTLIEGRESFEYIKFYEASSLTELIEKLERDETTESEAESNKEFLTFGKRISMPGYPFEKSEYWFVDEDLLFSLDDPLIEDHVVNGYPLVPAAVQLAELAKAISPSAENSICSYKNIMFYQNLSGDAIEGSRTEIENKNQTAFIKQNANIYSELSLMASEKEKNLKKNDLSMFFEQKTHELTKSECYKLFKKHHFDYGTMYQTLEEVMYSEHSALSRVKSSYKVKEGCLNPVLLDGAFQTVLVLLNSTKKSENLERYYPFSIKKIFGIKELPKEIVVSVKELSQKNLSIKSYDISIYDIEGELLMYLQEYMIKKDGSLPKEYLTGKTELQLMKKNLNIDFDLILPTNKKEELQLFHEKVLPEHIAVKIILKEELAPQQLFEDLFFLYKNIFKSGEKKAIDLVIFPEEIDTAAVFSLAGALYSFGKSLQLENPGVISNVNLCIPSDEKGSKAIGEDIDQKFLSVFEYQNQPILYQNPIPRKMNAYRKNSKIIIAGCGKIALKFAEHFSEVWGAMIDLLGRTKKEKLSVEVQQFLQKYPNATYENVDITDSESVEAYQKTIEKEDIFGVINCAGVIRDSFFFNKNLADFNEVLLPKTVGTYNLDKLTKMHALDFFILCSSTVSVFGNIGQADYAFANGFLDGFSNFRNTLVEKGKRRGATIAINLPYVEFGNMRVSNTVIEENRKLYGIEPLDETTFTRIIEDALQSKEASSVPLLGNTERIKKLFNF